MYIYTTESSSCGAHLDYSKGQVHCSIWVCWNAATGVLPSKFDGVDANDYAPHS